MCLWGSPRTSAQTCSTVELVWHVMLPMHVMAPLHVMKTLHVIDDYQMQVIPLTGQTRLGVNV